MRRTVHLHGRLGKKFGRRFDLEVNSPAEAIRALCVQLKGFETYIRDRSYVLCVDDRALEADHLTLGMGRARDLHISPAPRTGGIETIIILGLTLVLAAVSVVSILLMPKPPKPGDRERDTKTDSYVFDGPTNVTEQGHPVPVVYGRMRVGSVVASSGIATTDVNEAGIQGGGSGYVGSLPGIYGGPGGNEWYLSKGGKGGAGSTRSAQEDPNNLQSQATAKIADIVSEGEIVGLVNGLKSIYFDETPLQNSDGSYNFAGVAVEQRVGLPTQDPMPGFSQTENTRSIGTQVKISTGPVTRAVLDANADVARVTINIPRLFQQDTTNGDLKRTSVTIKISLQSNGGGFTDVVTHTFDGKNNAPYQRSFDIRLSGPAPHDIKVTRISPDSTLASLENETWFDLLTEIVEAKLIYPDTAMIGLTVDARQFGSSIPTRSYDIKGLIVEVPSNYNPVTRAYTGVWDGTFVRAWTDNFAWCVRDLITNRRYGLGARVPQSSLDKWTLYAIAQYCDELVPDGFGGTEPRYTCNCVLNTPAQAYEVIASFAAGFRGWAYWGSGSIMFAQDRPEDPSILVNRANVVGGKISYDRVTPLEGRRSVVIMYFNDPSDGYKLTPEIVEKPDLVRRFGWKPLEPLTAFGATSRGQAHRMALWVFEDEGASNTGASYEVGDDHAFVEPGRIASVADQKFTTTRRGGRIKGVSANQAVLDAPVTLSAGQTYSLSVVMQDATVSKRTVTNAAGTTDTLNLSGAAYSPLPLVGAVWTLESDLVVNRQFRIRGITTDKPPYKVRAVLHDPTKYARVEQNSNIAPLAFLSLPSGGLTGPGAISVKEFLVADGDAVSPSITVSWIASPDPRVAFYQAQYQRPGARWESFADSIDVSRDIRTVEPGLWGFRVRALDTLGRKTGWVQTTYTVIAQLDALPNPTGLNLVSDDDALTAVIAWTAAVDVRPLRYEVLFNTSNTFGSATSLGITENLEFPIKLAGWYWVRSVFMTITGPTPTPLQVTTAQLPEPKWTRTQGRPLNLNDLDPASGAAIVSAQTTAYIGVSLGQGYFSSNAQFANWSGAYPDDWSLWTGATVTKVAGLISPNAVRLLSAAGADAGLVHNVILNWSPGYWVLEASVTLESGSLSGAGVHAHSYTGGGTTATGDYFNLIFSTDPDASGSVVGAGVVGNTYHFSKMFHWTTAADSILIYMMNHYSALGSIAAANQIKWHRYGIRPATRQEVEARQALVDSATNAASILTEQSTRIYEDSLIAASVTTLSTTVSGHTTTLTSYGASISGIQAKYGVTIDAGGAITGFSLIGGGGASDFIIQANVFKVRTSAGDKTPFEVTTDKVKFGVDIYIGSYKIIMNNGTVMQIQGLGFGTSNQFLEWFGPVMAISSCSEANAITYKKTDGSAYFGGSLSAGILTTSAQTSSLSATASVETAVFGSNGGTISVVLSLSYSATETTVYLYNQSSAWNSFRTSIGGSTPDAFGMSYVPPTNESGTTTVELYRSINGGAYSLVSTLTVTGTFSWEGLKPDPIDVVDGYWTQDASIGGSLTYTDPSNSTQNRQYKAVMTSRTTSLTTGTVSQRISIVCTE